MTSVMSTSYSFPGKDSRKVNVAVWMPPGKAAGDLTRRVGLLLVVDCEREEVLPGAGVLHPHGRAQHHRVSHGDHDRTGSLPGYLARFQGDLLLAELKFSGNWIQNRSS